MNKDMVMGLLRHLLTVAGGALAAQGALTTDEATQGAGALLTLIGIAWSVYSKRDGGGPTIPPPTIPAGKAPRAQGVIAVCIGSAALLQSGCTTWSSAVSLETDTPYGRVTIGYRTPADAKRLAENNAAPLPVAGRVEDGWDPIPSAKGLAK